MKVKMKRTINGAVNGVEMGPYQAGREYELAEDRAALFLEAGFCDEVKPPAPKLAEPPKPSAAQAAPAGNAQAKK